MELLPGGSHQARFTDLPTGFFHSCLAQADIASLSLFGLPIGSSPSSKKLQQIKKALTAITPARIVGFYAARSWLGTTTRSSLIVLFALDQRIRDMMRAGESAFWSAGNWEDLALYRGNRVVMWTCTHEREGMVFGSQAELSRLNFAPMPVDGIEVRAEPLDASIQLDLSR